MTSEGGEIGWGLLREGDNEAKVLERPVLEGLEKSLPGRENSRCKGPGVECP